MKQKKTAVRVIERSSPSIEKKKILKKEKAYEEPLCMRNVKNEEDINICQYATAKYFELQVREIEDRIQKYFADIQKERFDKAQKNWRAMMEHDCEIQSYFYEGAGVYTAIISQCMQGHYRTRLKTLRNYLCPEHSLLNGCDDSARKP